MVLTGRAAIRAAPLELEVSELGSPGTPGEGDLLVNVTVSVGGYAAADQVWIARDAVASFVRDLDALERSRRSKALLVGLMPDEFEVAFFSTDSAGHMAVRGHVLDRTSDGHELALRFGFAFEPDALPRVLAESKVLMARSR